MDDEPFLSFNILEDDEELFLSSLEQFHKSVFNVKDILTKAVFLKYLKVVEQTLRSDLINPSDELVKYFSFPPGNKDRKSHYRADDRQAPRSYQKKPC